MDDPEITVLSAAIDEALLATSERSSLRLSKDQVMQLLREQLVAFSRPEFQEKVKALRSEVAAQSQLTSDFFRLPGRRELALSVQRELLPRFGLEGSQRGACAMVAECVRFCSDPEVARLIHGVNRKLGMEPSACQRYLEGIRAVMATGSGGALSQPAKGFAGLRPRACTEPIISCSSRPWVPKRPRASSCEPVGYDKKEVSSFGVRAIKDPFTLGFCNGAPTFRPAVGGRRPATPMAKRWALRRKGAPFSKAEALHLFSELLVAYSQPDFQRRMHELQRTHAPCSEQFGIEVAKLLRTVHRDILPRCGLDASSDGAQELLPALGAELLDHDVQVLAAACDEALYGPELGARSPAKFTKRQALSLLRDQLGHFSTPEFQEQVAQLRGAIPEQPQQGQDFLQLPGRSELALTVQSELLPRHGFEGSSRGVHVMLVSCCQYVLDPEVARYVEAIHAKLGMEASACKRFMQRLCDIQREQLASDQQRR
ncbi:unnamed protein product [Polarella glacialis]|uniref:Protein C10 n=1 Tax=Polarella glacialis TaxID=89957 RepID=A0A813H4T9_POLGL|nr:unnamed protein product [Polarella glacialis]